jgi:RNase H-fold protein (predicted Holliday junction resolvase)
MTGPEAAIGVAPLEPQGRGVVAALDPGRSKCGLVRTDPQRRRIVEALVLPPGPCQERLLAWHRDLKLAVVVLGDGTGSRRWQEWLAGEGELPVLLVDEHGSTLAARRRYWQLEPPQGWRRLLPEGMRQPPRDWDDVVAQLLLERWLGQPLERAAGVGKGLRRPPAL